MDKITSYITLCQKAGKLSKGYENTRHEILKGKVHLVLVFKELSENTKKAVFSFCEEGKIECIEIDKSLDEAEFYIGKRCGILGIEDAGFARAIKNTL